MQRDIRVYLAGPMFTSGRLTENIHEAVKVANRLRAAGFQVFIPHLYAFWDVITPHEVAFWLDADKHWLEACDVLFRIPGESVGGSKEEIWAEAAGLVFARPLTMADVGPTISMLISMADAGKIVRRVG